MKYYLMDYILFYYFFRDFDLFPEDMNYNLNKNYLYTDSDNEEFFKKNNNIKNISNKNENNYIAKTIKTKTRDIENNKMLFLLKVIIYLIYY